MTVSLLPSVHHDGNFAGEDEEDVVIRVSLFDKRALGFSWLDLNKINQVRQLLGKIFVVVHTLLCPKGCNQARVAVRTLEASDHDQFRYEPMTLVDRDSPNTLPPGMNRDLPRLFV